MTKPPEMNNEPYEWENFIRWAEKESPSNAKALHQDAWQPATRSYIYENFITRLELETECARLKRQVDEMAGARGRITERSEIDPKQFQIVAKGSASDGKKYEMAIDKKGNCPAVFSCQTGRAYSLSWQEIIAMGIAAGIERPTIIV